VIHVGFVSYMAGISLKSRNLCKFPVRKKKVEALLDFFFEFCLKRLSKVKCSVYREISCGLAYCYFPHQNDFQPFSRALNDNQ
jgi:hypothetical protein